MKEFNLSKELLFNNILIGMLSIGLVSCGGGSGSSSASSSSSPQPSLSFATYLYQGTDYQNEPIVTVYIDGQPIELLADTGASGLVVNQSAVNIPSSDYTSYTFYSTFGDGSTVSGTMASATVCLNPSIANTCVVMPIGVNTSGNAFPSSFEAQGDFGLDSSLNILDVGSNSSGSHLIGFSYPTYLARNYGINSYTINFYPLSNTFYAYVSSTTPIGQISFGTYIGNSNTILSYAGGFPSTTAVFPSYTSSKPSFTANVSFFDTGSNFNYLSTDVFQTEIPNFSQSADENACANYGWAYGIVNGGFIIAYKITNYSTSFTTEPTSNFCSNGVQWNLMIGNTLDIGYYSSVGYEDFGLPEMLRHAFVWVLGNNGLVEGIYINP